MNNRLNFVIRLVCAIIFSFFILIFLEMDNSENGMQVKARETNSVEVLDEYITIAQSQVVEDEVQTKMVTTTTELEPEPEVVEEEVVIIKEPVTMLYQTSAKTYMDYKCITNTNSPQWEYIYNSGEITVCEDGFLRTADGYIGVAMGSYFGNIGSKYILTLDTGITIPVVKVEAKADQHTVSGFAGYVAYDIIEFVIDTQATWMQENVWSNGYIFSGNFNNCELFNGKIIAIDKIIE